MQRTALVLGAGLSGLVAAQTLRKFLPASDRVIAVDRAERHIFPPSLLWLMVGDRKPEDFTRSLDRLIGRGVEFRHGDVTTIPLKTGRPLPKAGVFAHGQAAPRRFTREGLCFIETGHGRAGIGKGNFYAEPTPQVEMRGPNLFWQAGKILYEKCRLYRRF